MKEIVLDNVRNFDKILIVCKTGGHSSVACLSNAGLSAGKVRVTIVPNTAFEPGHSHVSDSHWMDIFNKLLVAKEVTIVTA